MGPTTLPTTAPIAGPTTAPATTQSSQLSDTQLLALFEDELGKLYVAADSKKYIAAHDLLEKYFTATAQKERAAIVKEIESTGVDANLVGRLTRIRRGWQNLPPGTYYINDSFGPAEVKYFLGIPKTYNRLQASSMVMVLPTADAFIANPPPDNLGVTKIYREWMAEELARQRDAIVLMPLLNLDELYGPSRQGMNFVIQPMLHTADVANIDPRRVSMIGHAMGAHAVWNLALHYPTYFSAIAPLAGAADGDWQRLRLMSLRNILPVVWDDSADEVNPVASSRAIVQAIRGMKFDIDYTETKNLGHVPPPQVINQVCDKMRARVRELYPKEVFIQSNKPEAVFNRADWVQIYQPIRPGPEQRLRLAHGSGPMIVNQNTCSVKATIEDNKVNVSTDNVLLMRLYFNDQLIDLKRAISIKVNGTVRYEGYVTPNLGDLLSDQLSIGRGWRYYCGFVDIDMDQHPGPSTTKPAK